MSRNELRLGVFIINHREDNVGDDKLRFCQDLMCDTADKEPKNKEKIVELLKYLGHSDVLETFQSWDLPKFPVSGIALLEAGVPRGPKLAIALKALREHWKKSNYTFTEKELLELADEFKKTDK